MALVLKHQTAQEFIARFRDAYRQSRKERTVKLARFIVNGIQAGDFTETQVRNAFGLTQAQWDVLKQKMIDYKAAHDVVYGAAGE